METCFAGCSHVVASDVGWLWCRLSTHAWPQVLPQVGGPPSAVFLRSLSCKRVRGSLEMKPGFELLCDGLCSRKRSGLEIRKVRMSCVMKSFISEMFWLVAMARCSCHGARIGLSSLSRSFHSFFDRFGTLNLPVYEEDWLQPWQFRMKMFSVGAIRPSGWPIQKPGTTLWHFLSLTMMLWWQYWHDDDFNNSSIAKKILSHLIFPWLFFNPVWFPPFDKKMHRGKNILL